MSQPDRDWLHAAALDKLIEQITLDANGEAEQIWAFRQAFEDELRVPFEAFVIGEPVAVIGFDYDGNERRGLTARCRRVDGSEYVLAACEIATPAGAQSERYLAAYRRWMGLAPISSKIPETPRQAPSPPRWWFCRFKGRLRSAVCSARTESSCCARMDRWTPSQARSLW